MSDVATRRRRGMQLQRDLAGADAEMRLTVLSSFNLDLLPPFMVEALDRRGVRASVQTGDFGQIAAQALNPASALYAGDPTDVLVVPAVEDILAALYADPANVARARRAGGRPPGRARGFDHGGAGPAT